MKILAALFYSAFGLVALYGCFWLNWGAMFAIFAGGFGAHGAWLWKELWEENRWRWR